VVAAATAVFVFHLDQNDRATARDLQRRELLAQFLQLRFRRGEERKGRKPAVTAVFS
jgi:hypothetical protein